MRMHPSVTRKPESHFEKSRTKNILPFRALLVPAHDGKRDICGLDIIYCGRALATLSISNYTRHRCAIVDSGRNCHCQLCYQLFRLSCVTLRSRRRARQVFDNFETFLSVRTTVSRASVSRHPLFRDPEPSLNVDSDLESSSHNPLSNGFVRATQTSRQESKRSSVARNLLTDSPESSWP